MARRKQKRTILRDVKAFLRTPLQLALQFFPHPLSNSLVRQPETLPVESDPMLKGQWVALRRQYFPDRPDLDTFSVRWSNRRQRRTLGSCTPERRQVVVAKELRSEECARWIEPLLFHELCHAVLGKEVSKCRGRRLWHGPEFKALVNLHPQTRALVLWMRDGGWSRAVRQDRARTSAQKRAGTRKASSL